MSNFTTDYLTPFCRKFATLIRPTHSRHRYDRVYMTGHQLREAQWHSNEDRLRRDLEECRFYEKQVP
jgi:hypothetical protein